MCVERLILIGEHTNLNFILLNSIKYLHIIYHLSFIPSIFNYKRNYIFSNVIYLQFEGHNDQIEQINKYTLNNYFWFFFFFYLSNL